MIFHLCLFISLKKHVQQKYFFLVYPPANSQHQPVPGYPAPYPPGVHHQTPGAQSKYNRQTFTKYN